MVAKNLLYLPIEIEIFLALYIEYRSSNWMQEMDYKKEAKNGLKFR